jgi:hypothetical protein
MRHIDFEALKYADFEVINSEPTPEEFRQISAVLKKHKEELARRGGLAETEMPASKKLRPLPLKRKNARAAAKQI